jgi:hypothetical protein
MKPQVRFLFLPVLFSVLIMSCTKNEGVTENSTLNSSLKQAIDEGALNLNSAMDVITSAKAFSILTMSDGTQKSTSSTDSLYKVYIPLDSIKGVYEYQPGTVLNSHGSPLIRFFTWTGDDNQMILNLPLAKIENPRTLRRTLPSDTSLTNNFSIAVSAYHNNYNSYRDFDYILASEISVDNSAIGNLDISYVKSPTNGTQYASQYVFSGSYTAKYQYESGDTTVSSFAILNGDEVLYKEQLLSIKNDTVKHGGERQYSLTIGELQIVRNAGDSVVEVYVNGVLQANAVVTIIDKEADTEASVCKKRDIQITFEDGTTVVVSDLIGQSIADIKTLFDSLHSVYFAAYVVDWIAYDVYYQRK